MGSRPARNQPPLRRPHQQHPRPHFRHLPPLFRPPDDGRPEPPLHPPHNDLHALFTFPRGAPARSHDRPLPSQRGRILCRNGLHPAQPVGGPRDPGLRRLRRCRPDLHLLHAEPLLQLATGDRHRHPQDAHHDAERALVWSSPHRHAVGGCRLGVWRRRRRGRYSAQGESS